MKGMDKTGRVIQFLQKSREMRGPGREHMHGIFKYPSRYAITYDLALKLSHDSIFKIHLNRHAFKKLDDLAEFIIENNRPLYLEKKNELTALRIFERLTGERGEEFIVPVISSNLEMGIKTGRFASLEVLYKGKKVQLPVMTVGEHAHRLREEFQVIRLMDMAYGEHEESALAAIRELSSITGALHIQRTLREISQDFEGRRGDLAKEVLEGMLKPEAEKPGAGRGEILGDHIFKDIPQSVPSSLLLQYIGFRLIAWAKDVKTAFSIFSRLSLNERKAVLELLLKDADYLVKALALRLQMRFFPNR